jgi:hypothetical protein
MCDLKYIIVALISHPNFKTAIIFNDMINHCDMVPKGYKAVSAGFCIIENGLHWLNIKTYGRSESLDLESRGIDTIIIRKTLERSIDMIDMDDPTEQNDEAYTHGTDCERNTFLSAKMNERNHILHTTHNDTAGLAGYELL